MKQLLAVTAVCLLALPLAAEEKAKEKEKSGKVESALVAAARKANRGNAKSVVITDEMVKTSKGHITTSTVDYMPTVPPKDERPTAVVLAEQRAKARADEEKKTADEKAAAEKAQADMQRRARLADAAENYEDGYDASGADPAQVERDMAAEAKRQEEQQP